MPRHTIPVLNWYAKDKKMTAGLRGCFRKRKGKQKKNFVTIRRGDDWGKGLRPGDTVAISISDDPANPNVIGCAVVVAISLSDISHLEKDALKKNIGAKNWKRVLRDMKEVYGESAVVKSSTVTVMEFTPTR